MTRGSDTGVWRKERESLDRKVGNVSVFCSRYREVKRKVKENKISGRGAIGMCTKKQRKLNEKVKTCRFFVCATGRLGVKCSKVMCPEEVLLVYDPKIVQIWMKLWKTCWFFVCATGSSGVKCSKVRCPEDVLLVYDPKVHNILTKNWITWRYLFFATVSCAVKCSIEAFRHQLLVSLT